MPLYPYPDVPQYPGVPSLVRSGAASQVVSLSLATLGTILLNSLQSQTRWGIYDASGQQLGGIGGLTLVESLTTNPTVLSTNSVDYLKETRVSDFPIEAGSFASYNKVELPANPVVVLNLSGTEADRSAFLFAIDDACKSTELYSVVTPEVTYANYSLSRYSYRRSAQRGANLITVEIGLEEIRQVSSAYAVVAPISSPQKVSATSEVSGGTVQPKTPESSTLKKIVDKLASLKGTN